MIAPIEQTIRTAVYTRVSTDEGLDQEFNSLDAQREAGEAYVQSQRAEGWVCVENRYDDGGFSGGTLARPALQQLITDIKEGAIDCVVTYKVDRLSRSLLDFARLMEIFEKHSVSFVSVTQQINSAGSMGRLMLNVLLSFAQFERELTAERTRDKMHAARRRGNWIGGKPPLGYDVTEQGGSLVVNDSEAEMVKRIFEVYLDVRSISTTIRRVTELGILTKRWRTKEGKISGGEPFSKTSMNRLLTNVIYLGEVTLEGQVYPGKQPAIVDRTVFEQVQKILKQNYMAGGRVRQTKHEALLRGLLRCANCDRAMVHATTRKNGSRVYRYYVCGKAQKEGWNTCPTKSVPAHEVEQFVVNQIKDIGKDPRLQHGVFKQFKAMHEEQSANARRRLDVAEKAQKGLQKQLNEAIRQRTGSDVIELLERKRSENAMMLRQARKEVDELKSNQATPESVQQALGNFDAVWESLSAAKRHDLLKLLFQSVSFDGEEGKLHMTFNPCGIDALLK